MDERLQVIVDKTKKEFGLDAYQLERTSIYKQRDTRGAGYYSFNMEWFPKELSEPVEEDYNPVGTAVIEYNIQNNRYESVIFVEGQSFSTKKVFVRKTSEEVAQWIEQQTGLRYGEHFKLITDREYEYHFISDVDGVKMSPSLLIEVKFDEEGRITFYSTYGTAAVLNDIVKSEFTLTLEEIEPLVKKQLQLVKFPNETDRRFVPVYAMEEVYVTVEGARVIPFLEHERLENTCERILKWDHSLEGEIMREEISFSSEASVDDAFNNINLEKLLLTEEESKQAEKSVIDVLRTVYPNDSGLWKLVKLLRREDFIEAHCKWIEEDSTLFDRKVVVFINPLTMAVLNYFDNKEMFDIFDSFSPAEKETVLHAEAFEKMVPYISVDPVYVYDVNLGKYVLCGLLDAAEAVDACTGEIIQLQDL